MEIEISSSKFHLDPSGAVFWPLRRTLLLSDLHLGKETVFQKSGMAIPRGSTESTLNCLRGLVESYHATQVIVLGDLLHAAVGLTPDLSEGLSSLLQEQGECCWVLVPGNHDRGGLSALRRCGWKITENRHYIDGVCLTHDATGWLDHDPSSISGHLHPSIRIPLTARESARVRCFWQRGKHLVLPAFGGWTGTHPIQPAKGDQVTVCVDGELIGLKDLRTA